MKRISVYFIFLAFIASCLVETEHEHSFIEYLNASKDDYEYELHSTIEGENYTAYAVRMISQNWLTPEVVDNTEWWHWVTIVVPDTIEHNTAMLWIGGGTNYDDSPDEPNPLVFDAALATNSITVDLHNVPNQPLSFINDDRLDERYEDDIIAYGWRKFLEGGASDDDVKWLSRYPMTTAAIRAMDTAMDFSSSEIEHQIDNFVVSGASKRGWTAWYTAIFDDRVKAVAPAVIDLLNMTHSFQHHWQAYGEWSPAIREYEDEQIMDWQFSVEYGRFTELVDPYSYLDNLDMPKYIVNAASDEFFLPDSWQFYWNDLPGEKYLRYVPNTGHSISETDAPVSLISFYNQILNDQKIPVFEWQASSEGFQIELDPDQLPDEILLWNAHNPEDRDFRLYVIDRIWLANEIEIPEDGTLFVEISDSEDGYTAWFVEATYHSETSLPFKQTTGVVVTPDTYPFDVYEIEQPLGTLP